MNLVQHFIILFLCLITHTFTLAQCPPSTLSLQTQQSADDFAANYPNCTEINGTLYIGGAVDNLVGLSNIKKVNGDLLVTGNTLLFDIAGFGQLDSIVGNLSINNNSNLDRITGFANLDWVGGNTEIINNSELKEVSGFEQFSEALKLQISNNTLLESIKGFTKLESLMDLEVTNNPPLEDLSGLETLVTIDSAFTIDNNGGLTTINFNNLVTVGGQLSISLNNALTDISGLQQLTTVGSLYFAGNSALTAITSFEGLVSIGSNLNILGNTSLTNIEGFDRPITIIGSVFIIGNSTLADCSVEAICMQLFTGGVVTVQSNQVSCSSTTAIEDDCILPCPMGDVTFNTQAQLNNFINTYPNCINFDGNMTIGVPSGGTSDILNISGLSNLKSISGDLNIVNNPVLTSIAVFDHDLSIGGNLTIQNNNQLSVCDVQAVCDYLALNGTANIQNNAPNCNSVEEVTSICTVSTDDVLKEDNITVFPNPSKGVFNILNTKNIAEIHIYNTSGKMVYYTNNQINTINISTLPSGMYWLKISSDTSSTYKKLLLQ